LEKIQNSPNVIIRGLGETDSRKKTEAKYLVTLSLSAIPRIVSNKKYGMDLDITPRIGSQIRKAFQYRISGLSLRGTDS
jgi:hypothetical protein